METVRSSSSNGVSLANLRALGDLEFMRSFHYCDLVVSVPLLDYLRLDISSRPSLSCKFLDRVNVCLILFACLVMLSRWAFDFLSIQ